MKKRTKDGYISFNYLRKEIQKSCDEHDLTLDVIEKKDEISFSMSLILNNGLPFTIVLIYKKGEDFFYDKTSEFIIVNYFIDGFQKNDEIYKAVNEFNSTLSLYSEITMLYEEDGDDPFICIHYKLAIYEECLNKILDFIIGGLLDFAMEDGDYYKYLIEVLRYRIDSKNNC